MSSVGSNPVWFITGCSTGFGRQLVDLLLADGRQVVATARDPGTLDEFVSKYPDSCLALKLDVTSIDDIAMAVEHGQQHFGAIDVLVNNAGYGYLSSIEDGNEQDFRAMFETNLFGAINLTRQVLPGMRQRKRGHIVNISSVAGFTGMPSSGYYSASKFALEGFSEALAVEVAPLGISVTIVEPSAFETDFSGRSLRKTDAIGADYQTTTGAVLDRLKRGARMQGDPRRGAKAIIDMVQSESPPMRLLLGANAVALARMKIEKFTQDVDAGEQVAKAADYPQG
jgi:NAD(P)-dependent dehydrogenase (short-subunit alcohol dehydrogenase family)